MSTSKCRVCLTENGCTRNIFTDKCSNGQSYAEALTSCLDGIQVVENNAVPSHICESCVSMLESWVSCGVIDDCFLSKYFSSNRLLMNANIKIEPEECSQIRQTATSTDAMCNIEIEEICLKTEPSDEYFQIEFDENDTDTFETKPYERDQYENDFDEKQHVRVDGDEKLYECGICKKTFRQKRYMKSHMWTHTDNKPHKCDQCGKVFRYKSVLRKHLRTHTGEKPYGCDHCGKAFSHKLALTYHLRTHTGEKPYECDKCGKAFSQKSTLTYHITTHTGEKPFKCEQCGKAFGQKSTLMEHFRTHTGERPYKCNHCEKAFRKKLTLRSHLTSHTGVKPYECNQCGKKFGQKSILVSHLRTHDKKKSSKSGRIAPDNRLSENPLTDNSPGTEWKYDDSSTNCTDVETVNIKTEEILIKIEPNDEYFRTDLDEIETDPLVMKSVKYDP